MPFFNGACLFNFKSQKKFETIYNVLNLKQRRNAVFLTAEIHFASWLNCFKHRICLLLW